MTTTATLSEWFEEGVCVGEDYMIVVCDTFNHEDYPVYCGYDEILDKYQEYSSGKNMQRVMEVYKLDEDKHDEQIYSNTRVFNPQVLIETKKCIKQTN